MGFDEFELIFIMVFSGGVIKERVDEIDKVLKIRWIDGLLCKHLKIVEVYKILK